MSAVSIRDLRNHGGDIVDRVQAGERVTVTRDGKPVAALVGLPQVPLPLNELIRRRAHLPDVDPQSLRAELDELFDSTL